VDNLEQVIHGAPAIAQLVEGCPGLAILATSREPLRVSGEQVVAIGPLDPAGCVRLLEERAAASAPGTEVDHATAHAICGALDRLPLAVELAAARLRMFSPDELLARLGDRLDAVGHGMRDRPDRQQTLRATIAWSVDLLDPRERDAFERLAVFVGGWNLEAADAIAEVDPEALLGLVDRSLVRRRPDGRFEMLETIRAFAGERFEGRADAGRFMDAHARWYGERVATLHRALDRGGPGSEEQYRAYLDAEGDNAWAALDRVIDRPLDDTAHRLVYGIYRYWLWRGTGRVLLARIRSAPWAARPFGGDPGEDARAGIAELERVCGDPRAAITLKEAELAHPASQPEQRAALHADLADLYVRQGMPAEARTHAEAAIELRRRLGDRAMEPHALCALVHVERAEGHDQLAARIAREVLRIVGEHPDLLWMTAELGGEMTPVLVRAGDVATARHALTMGIGAARRVRHDLAFALLVDGASRLAAAVGDHRLAVAWAAAADAAISRSGGLQPLARATPEVAASARAHLDRGTMDRLVAAGAEVPIHVIADEVAEWLGMEPSERR
jgi:predicted ATPase